MIKAIILDFDGVIIDSEKIWLKSKIEALSKNNIHIQKKINKNFCLGLNSNSFFKKFIHKKIYSKIINKVIKSYKISLKKNFLKTPKLNKEILNIFDIKNIKFCIVSNNSRSFIDKVLKKYKILRYFNHNKIIALRNTKFQKPNPYGYLKMCKILKYKRSEIAVVEDSLSGLICAKDAKMKYIFRYNPLKLKKIALFKNINSFFDLKKLILQINTKT